MRMLVGFCIFIVIAELGMMVSQEIFSNAKKRWRQSTYQSCLLFVLSAAVAAGSAFLGWYCWYLMSAGGFTYEA
jgi:hypothetical protein